MPEKIKCPRCNGEGSISYSYGWADSCPLCQGSKKVWQSEIDHFYCKNINKHKGSSYSEIVGAYWDDF